ncbi:MAG: hypothetical protein WBA57_23470 [Elainellaceae cyanobacterium]
MYDRARKDTSVISFIGDRSRQSDHSPETNPADQIHLALAIADETLLRSLLASSTPPIAEAHRVGSVRSTIGVRVDAQLTLDAVLDYEDICCVLAESEAEIEEGMGLSDKSAAERQRELTRLTQCRTDLQTFAHHATTVQAISLLAQVGFDRGHIQTILHLPYDAWHKSWWYALDDDGNFSRPFHRVMRTRRYADGSFTLQYRDFFSQEKPSCFKSRSQKVIVAIQKRNQNFSAVLSAINHGRTLLGIEQAILIGDRLSELEARGFMHQGVSLYSASDLVIPSRADCRICAQHDCPMHHRDDSPVTTCRNFCLGDWP